MDHAWSLAITLLNIMGAFFVAKYARKIKKKENAMISWIRGRDYKNVHVYVYDDDVQDLEFIEIKVLSKIENPSQVFTDQLSVLKKSEQGRNVYVVDNFSPGMTGVEMASRIKKANTGNWVIIFSGAKDIHVASEIVNQTHRADKFISKNGEDCFIALEKAVNEGIIIISNQ